MMNIYSVEFIDNCFPCALDNFTLYKKILEVNNNKYKLRSITKSKKSVIFTRYDNENSQQIKTLIIDGLKIKFFI